MKFREPTNLGGGARGRSCALPALSCLANPKSRDLDLALALRHAVIAARNGLLYSVGRRKAFTLDQTSHSATRHNQPARKNERTN
jgi:hypothetical protein